MIEFHGKPETQARDIETIIREGRELGHPAGLIAGEVREFIVEKLMERYTNELPHFIGWVGVDEFRKFITDGCQSPENI